MNSIDRNKKNINNEIIKWVSEFSSFQIVLCSSIYTDWSICDFLKLYLLLTPYRTEPAVGFNEPLFPATKLPFQRVTSFGFFSCTFSFIIYLHSPFSPKHSFSSQHCKWNSYQLTNHHDNDEGMHHKHKHILPKEKS